MGTSLAWPLGSRSRLSKSAVGRGIVGRIPAPFARRKVRMPIPLADLRPATGVRHPTWSRRDLYREIFGRIQKSRSRSLTLACLARTRTGTRQRHRQATGTAPPPPPAPATRELGRRRTDLPRGTAASNATLYQLRILNKKRSPSTCRRGRRARPRRPEPQNQNAAGCRGPRPTPAPASRPRRRPRPQSVTLHRYT